MLTTFQQFPGLAGICLVSEVYKPNQVGKQGLLLSAVLFRLCNRSRPVPGVKLEEEQVHLYR